LRSRPTHRRLPNPAPVVLRKEMLRVFAAYAPGDAATRTQRVAGVLRLLGVRFPNPKKDAARFRGAPAKARRPRS
jgi:hypothetical protein